MINISLNLEDEQIRKLQYIQQQTNFDLSELVSRNISALIDEHYQQLQPQSPLQIFEESAVSMQSLISPQIIKLLS